MHIHFMGIGGSGVSGLALIAKNLGHTVSGCDLKHSSYIEMAEKDGIKCLMGHSEEHLENVDILVYTSAVKDSEPELLAAKKREIPAITRGAFLAEILNKNKMIGIAGSHGKTSTTWMLFYILRAMGVNASVYAGSKSSGLSSVIGGEPWVVELDESDGSIFKANPEMLLVTNLEHEHVDFYKTSTEMHKSFENYFRQIKNAKKIIGRGYNLSDLLFSDFSALSFPSRNEIKEKTGFENGNEMNFFLENGAWYLSYENSEWLIGEEKLPYYIIQNRSLAMLSALYWCMENKIKPNPIPADFWETIPSIERRFEKKGTYKGIELIDDYGHHPSEVEAVLEMCNARYSSFAIVFQPHRISRFTEFYNDFKKTLLNVEPLIILPVYAAGETIDGKTSKELYEELKFSGQEVYYFNKVDEAAVFLKENWHKLIISGIVSVGAGDVNKIFEILKP